MRKGKGKEERSGKEEKRRRGDNPRIVFIFLLLIGVSFVVACKPNSAILNSQKNAQTAAAPEKVVTSYERDLETMRTANFDTILVIRRKDGGALDAADKSYIKTNSPVETNRFIVTDREKAVIAGSKFRFPPENIKILQDRFAVENLSKPIEETALPNANINANAEQK